MDESCGNLDQVHDNNDVMVPKSVRLRTTQQPLSDTLGLDCSSCSARTLRRTGNSLLDESLGGPGISHRRVRIEGFEGDLDDELGYIQEQINATSQPAVQSALSNTSS